MWAAILYVVEAMDDSNSSKLDLLCIFGDDARVEWYHCSIALFWRSHYSGTVDN